MQLQGFSKLLEKEVRHRLSNQSIKEIMKEIESSKNIYINEDTYDFHIIPLTHISDNNKKFILFKGLDEIYFKKNEIFKAQIIHIKNELIISVFNLGNNII